MDPVVLYQKGLRGETRVWKIWVVEQTDGSAVIFRAHGVENGVMTMTDRTITKGKNIGKKNETTAVQQAISEAKSTITKKKQEGYSEERDERGITEAVLPMLAQDYTKVKTPVKFPVFMQPKIDGVRMVVVHNGTDLVMRTRTGKDIFFLDHIRDELLKVLKPGEMLDGELFTPDKTFEEITGIVRKTVNANDSEDIRSIQYYVFDTMISGVNPPFYRRLEMLNDIFERGRDIFRNVIQVETHHVMTSEEADILHEKFTEAGYEGSMYRTPGSVYVFKGRSKELLKRKDFQTEEYRIVGAEEADGRDVGTVIWVCEDSSSGTQFNVRPRGSLEQRRYWWNKKDELIGKMLTVRFQNLTEAGGVPRFPVGVAIRDYE